MRTSYLLSSVLATLACLCSFLSVAQADGPHGGWAPPAIGPAINAPGVGAVVGGQGLFPFLQGGYRSPASLYSLGRVFAPPHFALHPPVYYSLPVPRSYGSSPFPRWSPEDLVRFEVQPILNPAVPPAVQPKAEPQAEKTAGGPQWILNPYCPQMASDSSASRAELAGQQGQTR